MNYSFNELFDQPKIEELLLGFFQLTGIPSAIIDLKGNFVLTAGWKRICTYYQVHDSTEPHACRQCELSMIDSLILEKQPQVIKKCAHGIMMAGAPIRVQGVPIVILMFGQFFIDTPEPQLLEKHPEIPIYSQQKLYLMIIIFKKLQKCLGKWHLKD